tara:strand:+ start:7970 stop:8701 length:732 start_codon:yes stop_codon:yes gene_type:complete
VPITSEQIQAAYNIAKDEYANSISSEDAACHLVSEHGWNESSAYGYIHTFLCMMGNKGYQRTINAYATEYYLRNIRLDFGEFAFKNAISSVQKHLKYYINRGKSSQPKIQALVERLINEFISKIELEMMKSDFDKRVTESLELDLTARNEKLESAPKKPKVLSVTTKVYSRNPDVVAAVLIRAKGICEKCKKSAPFIRAKDNSPYLEVHHKIMLANDGEDTVSNAIALCPNCHRESHYGMQNT